MPGLMNPGSCWNWHRKHESMNSSSLVSMVQAGGGGVPPSNLQQQCDAVASAWNTPVDRFRLVESMPRRIQSVLEANTVLDGCT